MKPMRGQVGQCECNGRQTVAFPIRLDAREPQGTQIARIGRSFVSFIRTLYYFPFPICPGEDQAGQQGSGLVSHMRGCYISVPSPDTAISRWQASRLVSETALFPNLVVYRICLRGRHGKTSASQLSRSCTNSLHASPRAVLRDSSSCCSWCQIGMFPARV